MSNKFGIIFDLDGTLLDTLEDLADSVNTILSRQGLPEHPVDAYRNFVGSGMPALVRRALPENVQDEDFFNQCLEEVRGEYFRRWANKTAPYPGILQVLEVLYAEGMPMAVLSNKPHDATVKTVAHFFDVSFFKIIQGASSDRPLKPDPSAALTIIRDLGMEREDMYLLGDSDVDMFTARNAGITAIGAAWGFRGRNELLQAGAVRVLEHPQDLLVFFRYRG